MTFEKNQIYANTTGYRGAGIYSFSGTQTVNGNTISMNQCTMTGSTAKGGGILVWSGSQVNGTNNIISGNSSYVDPEVSGSISMSYSCIPTGLAGTGNITSNPMFVNSSSGNFSLQSNSPCIDTGNPNSPLDPDGTRADMGALYFNQTTYSFAVALSPYGMPITVPANGGTFDYDIQIDNNENMAAEVTIWTMATLPNGSEYGPIVGPVTVTLPAGAQVVRLRTQSIPATAPSGLYSYDAYVGNYPGNIWDEDHFDFSKSAATDGSGFVNGWYSSGESFDNVSGEEVLLTPDKCSVLSAYPNPFNPETHLSFALAESGPATLAIYDITGNLVSTLYDGYANSGVQEITWNAGNVSSGVYFAVLQAGNSSVTQKLLLIK